MRLFKFLKGQKFYWKVKKGCKRKDNKFCENKIDGYKRNNWKQWKKERDLLFIHIINILLVIRPPDNFT